GAVQGSPRSSGVGENPLGADGPRALVAVGDHDTMIACEPAATVTPVRSPDGLRRAATAGMPTASIAPVSAMTLTPPRRTPPRHPLARGDGTAPTTSGARRRRA